MAEQRRLLWDVFVKPTEPCGSEGKPEAKRVAHARQFFLECRKNLSFEKVITEVDSRLCAISKSF
jgi:hypothetical protein